MGTEPPPPTDGLATMLAIELDRDVQAGVAYAALDEALAQAPTR